jgi:hypothetical protein
MRASRVGSNAAKQRMRNDGSASQRRYEREGSGKQCLHHCGGESVGNESVIGKLTALTLQTFPACLAAKARK